MLKNVSNSFKTACNSISFTYSEYVVLNEVMIPIKASLKDDCYENGNFIGSFIFKEIKFETDNQYDFKNKEFEYYKVVNGESIKIGTFITTEVEDNDTKKIMKVIGMDYGLKSQVEYKSTLNYDSGIITLLDVWNEACQLSGLESGIEDFENSDFIVTDDQFTGTGATIRDVFKAIALSSGSFVKVMNDDKIYLVFNETTTDIIEDYTDLEDKRDTHPITCLRIGMSQVTGNDVEIKDDELVEQYGENWLVINDNPFAYTLQKRQQLIEAIFNKVKGFGYSAFVSKTSFKPYLTCGDVIKFRNRNGQLINSILLRYEHNYDSITLQAPSETSATINYVRPQTEIDVIKKTEIIVDQNTGDINLLTQRTSSLENNTYTKEQTNELVQNASTGITNTFSEAGGNNVFRNTGLWFGPDTTTEEKEASSTNGKIEIDDGADNTLSNLKLYGNTSQEGTPTPDTPIPVNVVTGDNSITISNNDNTQSQTYPINLGSMELCKIGDYQDRIYKDNGKWYLNKAIGKVILDGSDDESWETSGASVDKGVKAYRTSFNISNLKTNTDIISNRFVNNRVNWFIDLSAGKMINTANNLYIRISKTIAPDVETLKTWLLTHNTIVYYILATPTTTEITDTELINQLNSIKTIDGYNLILLASNDVDTEFDITYLIDFTYYEYWTGDLGKIKEEKAANLNALLLQHGTVYQEQQVPNGSYTISFKYKKLINLANVKCIINDVEYELTANDDTEFVQTIDVSTQHIRVTFTSDIQNSCEIYDLMVNAGKVKLAYSQNQNETTTDTVNISKGITITSTDTDTTFKANADGIRTLDRNGNVLTKFTDTGMTTKEMIVEDTSQIVGVLVQQVGDQTWFTRL